jgi:hypothetical protein
LWRQLTPLLALCVLIALAVSHLDALSIRPKQTAGVKGRLLCDGKPAVHARVKLYHKGMSNGVVEWEFLSRAAIPSLML